MGERIVCNITEPGKPFCTNDWPCALHPEPLTEPESATSDAVLREKELAVVAHMKSGWHDGCQCEPCIAVREIVAAERKAVIETTLAAMERWCVRLMRPAKVLAGPKPTVESIEAELERANSTKKGAKP